VKRLLLASTSALFVLALAACGGDDDDSSASLPSDSDITVPDVSVPDVSLPDVSLPDVSLPDVSVPGLSIPDLSIPDVSMSDLSIPEGIEVTDEMIDQMVASMEQAGVSVDRDCVADAIEGVDLAVLTDQAQTMDPEFIQQFIACMTA
jgi:hypothetical protein